MPWIPRREQWRGRPGWFFWLALAFELAVSLGTTSMAKYLTQVAVREGINFNAQLLPDFGHWLLPMEDQWTPWLADVFGGSMILMQFGMLYILLLRGARMPQVYRLWAVWFWLHGGLMLMRLTTMSVTVLPTPMKACRVPELFWAAEDCTRQLADVWPSFSAFYCNDMMFSGHTSLFQFCAYMWLCAPSTPVHNFFKLLNSVMAVAGSLFVLIDRYHYSADMLVATYMTALVLFAARHEIRRCHIIVEEKEEVVVESPSELAAPISTTQQLQKKSQQEQQQQQQKKNKVLKKKSA
jgi:hypothetical protein